MDKERKYQFLSLKGLMETICFYINYKHNSSKLIFEDILGIEILFQKKVGILARFMALNGVNAR